MFWLWLYKCSPLSPGYTWLILECCVKLLTRTRPAQGEDNWIITISPTSHLPICSIIYWLATAPARWAIIEMLRVLTIRDQVPPSPARNLQFYTIWGRGVTIKISTQSMGNHFHIKNESVVFVNYRDWSPQTPGSLNTGLDWATITQMWRLEREGGEGEWLVLVIARNWSVWEIVFLCWVW